MPKDIPFARIALQKEPDAINLWIGNSRSVTALHKDNYENIYVQVLGKKHFVLMSPLCHPCVNEQSLPPASYVRRDGGGLELRLEDDDRVPFATWDPDRPEVHSTPYSSLAQPARVTLNPGDMLYLPAMWRVIPVETRSLFSPDLLKFKVSQGITVLFRRRHLCRRQLLVRNRTCLLQSVRCGH